MDNNVINCLKTLFGIPLRAANHEWATKNVSSVMVSVELYMIFTFLQAQFFFHPFRENERKSPNL